LASSIDIDPFVKEFGSIYESVKGLHSEKYSNDPSALLRKKILKIGSRIIRGEYLYEDDKDWIKSKAEKINVANASSGQQESLPMLVVLSALPYDSEFKGKFSIFIEEPEAHLFPIAQKHIVSILASIYKESSNSIFITTHSPYILSAFNVLITASDVLNKSNEKEVRKIIGEGEPVSFDDVSAYNISNGKAETIMDSETRLIGVNIIDEVSDSFNREFDNLLELGE
jgi:AAA15 family ATPase/GTPase